MRHVGSEVDVGSSVIAPVPTNLPLRKHANATWNMAGLWTSSVAKRVKCRWPSALASASKSAKPLGSLAFNRSSVTIIRAQGPLCNRLTFYLHSSGHEMIHLASGTDMTLVGISPHSLNADPLALRRRNTAPGSGAGKAQPLRIDRAGEPEPDHMHVGGDRR